MQNQNTPDFWDKDFRLEWENYCDGDDSTWRFSPIRFSFVSSLLPEAKEFEGLLRVLDIGCGLGHYVRFLEAEYPLRYYVKGIDFSEYGVKVAQTIGKKEDYSVGTCYETGYKTSSIDCVVAMDIIEHLDDVPRFLDEVKRILVPGGYVIVTTPDRKKDGTLWSPEHVKEYSRNGLVDTMSRICTDHEVMPNYQLINYDTGMVLYDPTLYYKGKVK